jgi:hypothetical protein
LCIVKRHGGGGTYIKFGPWLPIIREWLDSNQLLNVLSTCLILLASLSVGQPSTPTYYLETSSKSTSGCRNSK